MAYIKQTWVDHVEDAVTEEVIVEGTPVDKQHLDHIEDGIAEAHTKIDETITQIGNIATRVTNVEKGKATTVTYWVTISLGWTGSGPWTQSTAVPGILATDNPIVDLVLSGNAVTDCARLESWGKVSRINTYAGGITSTCLDDKPTVAIPIQLKVVR